MTDIMIWGFTAAIGGLISGYQGAIGGFTIGAVLIILRHLYAER